MYLEGKRLERQKELLDNLITESAEITDCEIDASSKTQRVVLVFSSPETKRQLVHDLKSEVSGDFGKALLILAEVCQNEQLLRCSIPQKRIRKHGANLSLKKCSIINISICSVYLLKSLSTYRFG